MLCQNVLERRHYRSHSRSLFGDSGFFCYQEKTECKKRCFCKLADALRRAIFWSTNRLPACHTTGILCKMPPQIQPVSWEAGSVSANGLKISNTLAARP